eukprot:GGOE01046755.1.p1 GENE.GGOE01046755.1~~GGOE01046755.1.p1  ORF type:complete len:373 (-),score=70.35 GGOE01046755.1:25-1116(-)
MSAPLTEQSGAAPTVTPQAAERMITAEEVRSRGDGVHTQGAVWRPTGLVGREVKQFLTAIMFLTRLPVPTWVDHDPRFLAPGLMWFPFVGAAVGVWAAVWFDALQPLLSPLCAAACAALAAVWITGCLHEDGFADCLDGLGGGWSREQILRIMKDSRVGTYAVVGSCLYLVAKVSVIAAIHEQGVISAPAALMAANAVGRWVALMLTYGCHYLSDDGDEKGLLYNTFAGCLQAGMLTTRRVIAATIFVAVWTALWLPLPHACLCMATACLGALLASKYAYRVLGGVMGDFLGATILVVELALYLVLLCDWSRLLVPGALQCVATFRFEDCEWGPWPAMGRLLLLLGPLLLHLKGAGAMDQKDD